MKIIFMGTPDFAVASLDALISNNFNVVAVVTAPDKPAGRGQQLQESAVKKYALAKGLEILQPANLKDENFLIDLKKLNADVQVVVAFRMLPEALWNMPPLGTYNLHASLLPRYRGAAPINWAIINGDKESGVTTFKLQHTIDTGNILFQEKVDIPENASAGELHDRLMTIGANLIVKTIKAISNKQTLPLVQQDDAQVTHAPKIFKEDCRIKWNLGGETICRLIRGLSPYPTAYTVLTDGTVRKTLKIFMANFEVAAPAVIPGSLVSDGRSYLKAVCADGLVNITELQLEGKKRMKVEEFLRGWKVGAESKVE